MVQLGTRISATFRVQRFVTRITNPPMISTRSMSRSRVIALGNLFLLLTIAIAAGDDSVHILSSLDQLVTSSTLRWVSQTQIEGKGNNDLVMGAAEMLPKAEEEDAASGITGGTVDSRPIYICRAIVNGIAVSGSQLKGDKHCKVSLSGTVRSHKHYDLLENVENASRLAWLYCDKFNWPLAGAVAAGEGTYVARHNRSTSENEAADNNVGPTHYIGKFDSKDGLGKIVYAKDGVEESMESGEVLVEMEPTSYELTEIKFTMKKKRTIKREPRVLGEATLQNSEPTTQKVAKAFTYSYNYSSYWGQGHAILKGLNMSITLANRTRHPDIWWGTETNEIRESVRTVEVTLEEGTAVNVTLLGKYTEVEIPYEAKLLSHYKDGIKMSRPLSGIYREDSVVDVQPEFSRVYYLSNYTLVPTTTTTTTTTTKPPVERPLDRAENGEVNPDGNSVVPGGEKGGDGDMQSDVGQLTLKNEFNNIGDQNSGAQTIFSPSEFITTLLLTGFLILVAFRDRPTSWAT